MPDSDAPWDEGPVDALRARIAELTEVRDVLCKQMVLDIATIGQLEAQRDRAVGAVRQLRAALDLALNRAAFFRWEHSEFEGVYAALAATAEWEAP